MPSGSKMKGQTLQFSANSVGYNQSIVSVLKFFMMCTYFNFNIEKLDSELECRHEFTQFKKLTKFHICKFFSAFYKKVLKLHKLEII